jgi:DNA helicase II / ATP-dependent DNA helicase PcrA
MSSNSSVKPTTEQQAIIDFALGSTQSMLINALAGAAKTTTLEMIASAMPIQPMLSLAFNKRIAEEMKKKLPGHVQPMTLNSIGHRTWAAATGKRLTLATDKIYALLKAIVEPLPRGAKRDIQEKFPDYLKAIRAARVAGYIPASLGKDGLISREDFIESLDLDEDIDFGLVDAALGESIKQAFGGLIDFDDQIYMPTLFGGAFPRYPIVMVDEAQDLSGINHAMLERIAHNARLLAVGDPWQSIYGFRGAVQSSMARLKLRFDMSEHTLSVSFRCPQAVVRHAWTRVPHMRWPEWAIEGSVNHLEGLRAIQIPDGSAIICRNNAPLLTVALRLLREGRGVQLVGTDLGPQLIKALKKLGPEGLTQSEVHDKIDEWEAGRIAARKPPGSTHDRAECLRVFAGFGKTLSESVAYAEDIFKRTGPIQLLSGHKAKGLEWDNVYHLDPWRVPSKYATSEEEVNQEKNVGYVITTRAKRDLNLINLGDIQ